MESGTSPCEVPTWLESATVVFLAVSMGMFAIVMANILRVQAGVSEHAGALPTVAAGLIATGWMSGAMLTRLAPHHVSRLPWWGRYVFIPALTGGLWTAWLAWPGINTQSLSMGGLAVQMTVTFFAFWMLLAVFDENVQDSSPTGVGNSTLE